MYSRLCMVQTPRSLLPLLLLLASHVVVGEWHEVAVALSSAALATRDHPVLFWSSDRAESNQFAVRLRYTGLSPLCSTRLFVPGPEWNTLRFDVDAAGTGRASRRFLSCVGDCSKPGPPNLSLSWAHDDQQSELELGSGTAPGVWGSTNSGIVAGFVDEEFSTDLANDGGEGMSVPEMEEDMEFPEVEAQQYYNLGVLKSLSQSLHTPSEAPPSLSTNPDNGCNSIPTEINRYANLVILSRALEVTGLADTLGSEELEATLFAPTDLAFETLAESQGITIEELLEDTNYLSKVLKLHLAPSALYTHTLGASQSVDTYLVGHPILVTSSEKGILVVPPGGDPAHVQLADITACSSVLHIVDHVLSYVEDWDLGMFTG